jgi:uncharacterized protein YbjT (DUF2867 family)
VAEAANSIMQNNSGMENGSWRIDSQQKIAVDGASGYLGSHLVSRLRQQGHAVRALVHPGARSQDVDFLRSCGAEIVVASLEKNDAALVDALKGCSVVVHLIGSIAPKKGERLEQLHGDQTRNLASAAKAADVAKIVQVTALGTNENARNGYHASKWQAEQHVRNSGCRFVILRPSLIIGRQVGNRDSKLVTRYFDLIKTRPAVPVIGGGHNKIQPVFIADLVAALEKAICSNAMDNQVYEIGGAEILPMREFVAKLTKLKGSDKAIRPVPVFAANIAAVFCQAFQDVPLVSSDQIKLSTEDNVCSNNSLSTIFGITPTPIDVALRTYSQEQSKEAARV